MFDFPRNVSTFVVVVGTLRARRAFVRCLVGLVLSTSAAEVDAQLSGGVKLNSPPTSLGNAATLRAPTLSTGGVVTAAPGTSNGASRSVPPAGLSLQEPPRQLLTSQPPLSFDPYSAAAPQPVLQDPSRSWLGGTREPTPDETIWDDAYGVYDREAYHDWSLQLMPAGLIYKSYLAGVKEPRLATVFNYDKNQKWIWDITLGGRVALLRYGTTNAVRPEGFEIDLEGAAMPRLNMMEEVDLDAVDFRAGLPVTYGIGRWQTKVAYYHLSAHAGDEFLERNPGFQRVNYVRDMLVVGQSYYITDDVRLYGEAGYGFYTDVAEPWEFQFGADYSPLCAPGARGAPFAAINGYLREEVNFSGNVVVQAGWQWRPRNRGQTVRIGLQYYNGKSEQFEFYNQNENKVGIGIWYDY